MKDLNKKESIFDGRSGEFVLEDNCVNLELNSGKLELSCAVSSWGYPELDDAFLKWFSETNEDVVIRFKFSFNEIRGAIEDHMHQDGRVDLRKKDVVLRLREELASMILYIDTLEFYDVSDAP